MKNSPSFAICGLSRIRDPRSGLVWALSAFARAMQGLAGRPETIKLANTADLALIGAPDAGESFSLANIANEGSDGWALIAKYGNHPHPGPPGMGTPMVQRFERQDADVIVANYKQGWGRIKRAFVGIPAFNGHPDVKGYEKIFPDKTVYGTFGDLKADDVGLWGQPVLTNTGSRLVEDGKDRLSPTWDCKIVGKTPDGKPIAAPFKLKSVGLVERGNIPGPTLMNSAFSEPMKNKLIQLLALLGITATPEADDTALANFCEQALPKLQLANTAAADLAKANEKITALEGEKLSLANAKSGLETEKLTLSNSVTTLTTERDGLKTSLAAERKERAVLLANAAVTDGRITGAERDSTVTELCNAADFTVAAAALAAKKKKLPTASKTTTLGNSMAGQSDSPGMKIIALANARMASHGEDYVTAFTAVQADPANAALFAQQTKKSAA